MSRATSPQKKKIAFKLREPSVLKGGRREVPLQVELSFSEPKNIPSLARNLKLSAEAKSALALFSRQIQQEILTSVESDNNNAQQIPGTADTFVAKSPNGFRIVYQKNNNTKSLMQILTPAQLNGFKKVMG